MYCSWLLQQLRLHHLRFPKVQCHIFTLTRAQEMRKWGSVFKLRHVRQSLALFLSNLDQGEVTASSNSCLRTGDVSSPGSSVQRLRWVIGLRALVLGSVSWKLPHTQIHSHTCTRAGAWVLTLLSINTYRNREWLRHFMALCGEAEDGVGRTRSL